MENSMMKAVKNMALGRAVGVAAVAAGAVYAMDSRAMDKTANTMKRTGKKIVRAGQSAIDDMTDMK